MNDVSAEGQGQAVVLLLPPRAQILAHHEPFLFPRQLTFVDDEPGLGLAGMNRLENLIEGNNDKLDFGGGQLQPKLQSEKRAGHRPRDSDSRPCHFGAAEQFFGDQHRAVTIAHARTARQQCILAADISIGVDANGGDIQFAARGALVQSLDVLKDMLELIAMSRNQPLSEAIKHECIIGIGRMPQR